MTPDSRLAPSTGPRAPRDSDAIESVAEKRDTLAATILEYVDEGVVVVDVEGTISHWSGSAECMFGLPASDALGRTICDVLPSLLESPSEADILAAIREGRVWRGPATLRLPEGSVVRVESVVTPLLDGDVVIGAVAVNRDVTAQVFETGAREAAERALRALTGINRELIRESDESSLVQAACRIIVDTGRYRLAWIGYARDDEERSVEPMAAAGLDAGYVETAHVSWADEPRGRGPIGIAVRSGRPDVLRDPSDPRFGPWLAEANRRGFAAVAALPLRGEGRAFGVLTVYADRAEAFEGTELDLLSELADDLAYGILARRTRAAHERAIEAVRLSEQRYRTVVEALAEGVVLQDETGTVVSANPAARAILGWKPAAAPASLRWPPGLVREDGSSLRPDELPAALTARTGRAQRDAQVGLRRASGELRWIAIHADPLPMPGGGIGVVSSFEDVTVYRRARADETFEIRLRAALLEAVNSVGVEATLEDAARAICGHLASLPAISLVGMGLFLGEAELQIIATEMPVGLPELAMQPFSEEMSRYLHDHAVRGPWAQHAGELAALEGWWRDVSIKPEITAIAFGPIAHRGHVEGLLAIGTQDPDFARTLVARLPAVAAFSATSSGLLGERLHQRRARVETRRGIEAVLESTAFHPVFQAVVDLETGAPAGYEALTRFASGIRPDVCFADAWAVGLGDELELATLRAAVAASSELPAGLWLDLNISPRLLPDTERVAGVLRDVGRPVVLEVTEHQAVADYEALRNAVRALGNDVRLAVDDAGAGVANFGHIIELRPDFVKLDMSLVRRVNAHLGRQALVVAMRHFARSAGCRLVAEGVETELEAATLRQLGVEFGQGYLFGRPERHLTPPVS